MEHTVLCIPNLNSQASMILGMCAKAEVGVPVLARLHPYAHTASPMRTSAYSTEILQGILAHTGASQFNASVTKSLTICNACPLLSNVHHNWQAPAVFVIINIFSDKLFKSFNRKCVPWLSACATSWKCYIVRT